MVQKPWFKLFVWFLTTSFFFIASGVIISMFRPGPSEAEVMRFMAGMMGAMSNSIMGMAMGVEHNSVLSKVLAISYFMFTPIVIISIVTGFTIRLLRGRSKDVR